MNYTEYYSNVKSNSLRGTIRKNSLDILSFWNSFYGNDHYKLPRIQFLYFHHVFKDEEKNLELLLDKLSQNHTFISYSDAVTMLLNGKIDKPYICFSSDDGLKNNLNAAQILSNYNAKTCFFINPSIIGEKNISKIESFCRDRLKFPLVEFMNWNDIEKLQKMGHEIGSHTMDHVNIATSTHEITYQNLFNSFEIIKANCGAVKHFAFPYGRFFHFNEEGRKLTFEIGYQSCGSAERGCHINSGVLSKEKLCIRRDQVVFGRDLQHIQYFIASNSKKASNTLNYFPYL